MKLLYTVILLIFSASVYCQTYYWVGGSGSWSELSHWATSSGGNTFHTQLPGSTNDVVFDQNSFTAPGQVVSLDMDEALCKNFNTLNVTNNPSFLGDYYLDQLSIYGSLMLGSSASYDLKTVNLLQSSGDCLITSGSTFLGGLCFIKLDGGANYYLQDSISVANIYVYNAKFYTNDYPVHCSSRFRSNFFAGREVHLGQSNLYTSEFVVTGDMVMDAQNSTIKINSQSPAFGEFDGAGFNYGDFIAEGYATLVANNSFQNFTVLPGTEVSFTSGTTQTAQNFVLQGTAIESVQLKATEPGSQANLSQSSGVVNGNYLVLQDMNATGGAVFNANNTADLGNNTGWNIIQDVPANYYWVNGAGNWTDLNHWATTSGGNIYHLNLPNAQDTVIIDNNSFALAGVLTIDSDAYCAEFRMNNAVEGIQINGNQALHCYGSMTLSEGAIGNFYLIYAEGENTGNTITTNGAHWGEGSTFVFSSTGEWLLNDEFFAGSIEFNNGIFRSEGQTINLHDQINSNSNNTAEFDLSNSVVNLHFWRPFNTSCNYILSGSSINCSDGDFYGLDLNYNNVKVSGQGFAVNDNFTCNSFEIVPGSSVVTESGIEITADNFILNGSLNEPISIESSEEGEESFFVKNSGTVDATYLVLKDNHATGGAQFNAVNSEFVSNVEGWQLIIGVEEIEKESNIYPNPAFDYTRVPALAGEVLSIVDYSGRYVIAPELIYQSNPQINIEHLIPGLYIIQISGKNSRSYQLIVN